MVTDVSQLPPRMDHALAWIDDYLGPLNLVASSTSFLAAACIL